jgi:hypothetical protein
VNCRRVRARLSEYLDRELPSGELGEIARHLSECEACEGRHRSLRGALDALQALPRPEPGSSIAAAVRDRIEVERRGPGLQLLFRPAWRARPLILPSLVQAALACGCVLGTTLALNGPARLPAEATKPPVAAAVRLPQPGTESNPFVQNGEISAPRVRSREPLPERYLRATGEASVFLETVVARDGSIAAVTLIGGDARQARTLATAIQHERFEPARLDGRPVAISMYRLFSRMEVGSQGPTD